MEQKLYTLKEEPNKICEEKLTDNRCEDYYLQNDNKNVSIHMLNDDCLKHIFKFLTITDRVRIEIVCKRWRDLSQNSWNMVKTLDILPSTCSHSYNSTIHTALLEILDKHGKHLTRVNLNTPIGLRKSDILPDILKLCPNFTTIDVTETMMNASGIRILATNCKNVTKFKLGQIEKSSDEDELEYLFTLYQNLEYLAMTHSYGISGKCLLCLPEQTVHTIILDCCEDVEDYHLSMALKKLKNLKHLAINKCFVYDLTEDPGKCTLEVIGQHHKNLKTLKLENLTFAPDILHNLIDLVNLQVLKITRNSEVSDDFLINLVQHCRQLRSIDITGCSEVSDAGLSAIATLARLEKLIVSGIHKISDDCLKNVCGLKEFECRECPFSDQHIITLIKSSPRLKLLDLSGCILIGDNTLDVAIDVCSSRTNYVVLTMIVGGTKICTKRKINQEKITELLYIVDND